MSHRRPHIHATALLDRVHAARREPAWALAQAIGTAYARGLLAYGEYVVVLKTFLDTTPEHARLIRDHVEEASGEEFPRELRN